MQIILAFIASFIAFSFAGNNKKAQMLLLSVSCIVLTFVAGFRSLDFPDTRHYIDSFIFYTNNLWTYSIWDVPDGYSDKGFYFLSAVIKTFTSDYRIYLIIISILTFIFLYKSLKEYSILPLIGLLVYVSRFFIARNMMQIRAALAIVIVVYSIKYISRQDLKRFLLWMLWGTSIHLSMILAIPLYWINKIQIDTKKTVISLAAAFAIAFFAAPLVRSQVEAWSIQYGIAQTYTVSNATEFTEGLGLLNPMIYYQTALLLFFTFYERKIKNKTQYYTIIRSGYLYSTLMLILFSSFATLSGRTSTIFATFEIFIIPALIKVFPWKWRFFAYCICGCCLTIIFYMNASEWI